MSRAHWILNVTIKFSRLVYRILTSDIRIVELYDIHFFINN